MMETKGKKLIKKDGKEYIPDPNAPEHEDDEDCNYSYKKIWRGYKGCVEFSFMGVYSCFKGIKNGIYNCVGCCFYPIKERLCNCCDNVHSDLNPYANPNYNPYDHL